MTSDRVRKFWEKFCSADASVDASMEFQVWHFGNTAEMAAELASLVIAGKKTATASLMRMNELRPQDAPQPDGYSVVTDFKGQPLCVVRTTEIQHVPFEKVGPQFAADEGEGDLSLGYWRRVHRDYFLKEAAANGFDFNERSLICCERFKLVFPR